MGFRPYGLAVALAPFEGVEQPSPAELVFTPFGVAATDQFQRLFGWWQRKDGWRLISLAHRCCALSWSGSMTGRMSCASSSITSSLMAGR